MENHFSNNFITSLMENYNQDQAMPSNNYNNNNANPNTNDSITINNNHHDLITTLQEFAIKHLHSLILLPLGNIFLLDLLDDQSNSNSNSHITFINLLLLGLTSSKHHFLAACLHHLGHRVVVKLISCFRYPCQGWTIALHISPHILALAKDFQGGHQVLRSCFQNLSPPPNELIFLRITENCSELARDQAGCCILQECIEYSHSNLGQIGEHIISPLIQNAYNLSTHPYGNYVIQFMVQLDGENIGRRIIKVLRNEFVALCVDKFGSNVMEKCLSCCEGGSDYIISKLLENNNQDELIQICTNQYGNYVIQTAISVAKGNAYKLLERAIKSQWLVLQSHPYGKNVIISAKRDKKKSKLLEF